MFLLGLYMLVITIILCGNGWIIEQRTWRGMISVGFRGRGKISHPACKILTAPKRGNRASQLCQRTKGANGNWPPRANFSVQRGRLWLLSNHYSYVSFPSMCCSLIDFFFRKNLIVFEICNSEEFKKSTASIYFILILFFNQLF